MSEERTSTSDGVRLLTVDQYSKKLGFHRQTVWLWCKNGVLPGAVKAQSKKTGYVKFVYLIPEDAVPVRLKRNYVRKSPPKPKPMVPPTPKPKLKTEREKNLHIRKYCGTHSIRSLAQETGLSVEEVRMRYERLFARGDG